MLKFFFLVFQLIHSMGRNNHLSISPMRRNPLSISPLLNPIGFALQVVPLNLPPGAENWALEPRVEEAEPQISCFEKFYTFLTFPFEMLLVLLFGKDANKDNRVCLKWFICLMCFGFVLCTFAYSFIDSGKKTKNQFLTASPAPFKRDLLQLMKSSDFENAIKMGTAVEEPEEEVKKDIAEKQKMKMKKEGKHGKNNGKRKFFRRKNQGNSTILHHFKNEDDKNYLVGQYKI